MENLIVYVWINVCLYLLCVCLGTINLEEKRLFHIRWYIHPFNVFSSHQTSIIWCVFSKLIFIWPELILCNRFPALSLSLSPSLHLVWRIYACSNNCEYLFFFLSFKRVSECMRARSFNNKQTEWCENKHLYYALRWFCLHKLVILAN